MGKDPAFLFYPNDWIGGTMGMTFEEKGAYMELLMMQFNRGHMTTHMVGQVVGQLLVKLEDKFTKDEDGNWYNERLEEEIEKRKAFTASRKNNLTGANQYTKKTGHKVGHMTSHMENENEDVNIKVKNNKFTIPTVKEISEYCKERKNNVDPEKFFNFYESKGWLVGKTKMKDWRASVRTWEKNDDNKGVVSGKTFAEQEVARLMRM